MSDANEEVVLRLLAMNHSLKAECDKWKAEAMAARKLLNCDGHAPSPSEATQPWLRDRDAYAAAREAAGEEEMERAAIEEELAELRSQVAVLREACGLPEGTPTLEMLARAAALVREAMAARVLLNGGGHPIQSSFDLRVVYAEARAENAGREWAAGEE